VLKEAVHPTTPCIALLLRTQVCYLWWLHHKKHTTCWLGER